MALKHAGDVCSGVGLNLRLVDRQVNPDDLDVHPHRSLEHHQLTVREQHGMTPEVLRQRSDIPVEYHIVMAIRPLAVRFWEKVDMTGDCWIWTAARYPNGYGKIGVSRAAGVDYAHRVCWRLTNGQIPTDLKVLHRCDNRLCVRPDHLFLGTTGDNNRDRVAKLRGHIGERHPAAKLTSAQVAEIRARYTGKRGQQAALAVEFDASRTVISEILNGNARKHG